MRPVAEAPSPALNFTNHPAASGLVRIDQPDVIVRAIAGGGSEGEQASIVRPCGTHVARLSVGEQRDTAIGGVVAVELIGLASAGVLTEDDALPRFGAKAATTHRLGKKSELPAVTARALEK